LYSDEMKNVLFGFQLPIHEVWSHLNHKRAQLVTPPKGDFGCALAVAFRGLVSSFTPLSEFGKLLEIASTMQFCDKRAWFLLLIMRSAVTLANWLQRIRRPSSKPTDLTCDGRRFPRTMHLECKDSRSTRQNCATLGRALFGFSWGRHWLNGYLKSWPCGKKTQENVPRMLPPRVAQKVGSQRICNCLTIEFSKR
jgi:hypothetical protein